MDKTTVVYHGTVAWRAFGLATGQAENWHGLYVTDTEKRAQLYADSVASHYDVSRQVRKLSGSVVAELETNEPLRWLRRPEDHPTLDHCEATIKTWRVCRVVAYARQYDLDHSVCNVGTKRDPQIVRTYEHLQTVFGDLLTIVMVD